MYRYIVIRVVELARERTKQRRHLKACLDVAVPAQDNCELLQHLSRRLQLFQIIFHDASRRSPGNRSSFRTRTARERWRSIRLPRRDYRCRALWRDCVSPGCVHPHFRRRTRRTVDIGRRSERHVRYCGKPRQRSSRKPQSRTVISRAVCLRPIARSAYITFAAVKYAYRRGKSSAAVRAQPRPLTRSGLLLWAERRAHLRPEIYRPL